MLLKSAQMWALVGWKESLRWNKQVLSGVDPPSSSSYFWSLSTFSSWGWEEWTLFVCEKVILLEYVLGKYGKLEANFFMGWKARKSNSLNSFSTWLFGSSIIASLKENQKIGGKFFFLFWNWVFSSKTTNFVFKPYSASNFEE